MRLSRRWAGWLRQRARRSASAAARGWGKRPEPPDSRSLSRELLATGTREKRPVSWPTHPAAAGLRAQRRQLQLPRLCLLDERYARPSRSPALPALREKMVSVANVASPHALASESSGAPALALHEIPVELDAILAPRILVEVIHVLRDKRRHSAHRLELCDRHVARVGLRIVLLRGAGAVRMSSSGLSRRARRMAPPPSVGGRGWDRGRCAHTAKKSRQSSQIFSGWRSNPQIVA